MPRSDSVKSARKHTFEIGLCMAGAISAGAYTAGVVDFLLEALEAWQKAKANGHKDVAGNRVLSHDTVLTCMAGASAGGMTAAAIAAGLCGKYEPVNNLKLGTTPTQTNIPYACWVESVSIKDFLGTDDLGPGPGGEEPVVRSLLDCTTLDTVAGLRMKPDGSDACVRPYIARDLEIFLTLANLRGTPYVVPFKGETGSGHEMTLHQDNIRFRLTRSEGPTPADPCGHFLERIPPRAGVMGDAAYWEEFKTAALATGAFPLALLPRVLQRDREEYANRDWVVPHPLECPKPCSEETEKEPFEGPVFGLRRQLLRDQFQARKLVLKEEDSFEALNVDGGTFDNEPLELVRLHLAGDELVNPRTPEEAHRAVVLIDPFPHEKPKADAGSSERMDVLAVAGRILGAMKANARFKPEELVLAQDENCYSRFLVGPSRKKGPGSEWQTDIACGSLGGFGGFFSKNFRQHDYQLGRRNCQWFLYKHFVIPLEAAKLNPVFEKDRDGLEAFAYEVTDELGKTEQVVPIVPLMPEVHPRQGAEVATFPWDRVQIAPEEVDCLRPTIAARLEKVADIYLNKYIDGVKGKLVKWFFLGRKLRELADTVLATVHEDFRKAGVER